VFDIGFTEMMVIGVVALLVIGPKQLPTVARQVGQWAGKLRRYVDDVKSDFNKQAELDELRKIKDDFQSATSGVTDSLSTTVEETRAEFDGIATPLTEPDSAPTDWDKIWATRRTRDRLKERRKDRQRELGLNRPKFRR
jgi:sec-independent protein translocase protein TatB